MTISELIKKLEELRDGHGDVPVCVQTLSHVWDPDPVTRGEPNTWVLLNP